MLVHNNAENYVKKAKRYGRSLHVDVGWLMIHLAEKYIEGLPLLDSRRDRLREYVLTEIFAYRVKMIMDNEGKTEEKAVEQVIYEVVLSGL